jgi:hypothetical protein
MKRLIDIFFTGLVFICCCTTGDAPLGGTSEQGNARVAATIYNTDMSPSVRAHVKLRRTDYIAGAARSIPGTGNYRDAITGADGSFFIDSLDTGSYYIEVNDRISNAVLLKCSITSGDTLVALGKDTLLPYSSVKGKIQSVSPGKHYLLKIEGLERFYDVNTDGSFIVPDLPQGTFTFIIDRDSFENPIVIPDVITESGKLTILPGDGRLYSKPIYFNTTSSGAPITSDLYGFPVLIRLNSSNFTFNEAKNDGSDIRFIKTGPYSTLLPFEIERWDATNNQAEIWVTFDTISGNSDKMMCIMQWGNSDAPEGVFAGLVFDTAHSFGAVWHLSDNISVTDATPNRFTGLPSSVDRVEGIIGNAGGFTVVNMSHITVENSALGSLNFPPNGSYTISAWVNADSTASNRVIIGKGDLQYYLRIHSLNWHFAEYHDTPSKGWEFTASPYSSGKWVYVCGVRSGTSQYLYIDGICVDSSITIMGDSDGTRTDTFNIDIGRKLLPDGSGSLHFSGIIDEVRICTTARSADWIKLCYYNQRKDDLLVKIGN